LFCRTHPTLATQLLLVKIPNFEHFIWLDGIDSVFRLINILFVSFLAAGFFPKNVAFAGKIMTLLYSGSCSPSSCTSTPSPWLVRVEDMTVCCVDVVVIDVQV